MKAHLRSIRIAPKKANLIAKMVRGMSVPDAMESLRRTNKKGARMLEQLLRSAIANASHNDRQDPQTMVIKTVVVNQGTAYRRGMPKARGQMRPYRKFLSHISITLGFPGEHDEPVAKKEGAKKTAQASQEGQSEVKTPKSRASQPKKKATSASSEKSSS
jgi:large subunit ribosomal protein L22